jgi:hypothetical protein
MNWVRFTAALAWLAALGCGPPAAEPGPAAPVQKSAPASEPAPAEPTPVEVPVAAAFTAEPPPERAPEAPTQKPPRATLDPLEAESLRRTEAERTRMRRMSVEGKEEQHLASAYESLSTLPKRDFLVRAMLLRLLPQSFLAQADPDSDPLEYVTVAGDAIGYDPTLFLVWAGRAGLDHALVVMNERGKRLDSLHVPNRAQLLLRDVIGDARPEVIISRTDGMAVSRWPVTWLIYRVTSGGRLRRLLTHPKSYSEGSKYENWAFINHFESLPNDRLRVETIHSRCDPADPDSCKVDSRRVPPPGTVCEFSYDRRSDRYAAK